MSQFSGNLSSNEINVISSTNSDDTNELLLMSPTDSIGRSSTSSIPWAEDAIRQNQLEWERIERMFYGEEELPADPKLKTEFIEWMTAFPHLRVTGKKINTSVEKNYLNRNYEEYEEIIAIDPPLRDSYNEINDNFFMKESTAALQKYNRKSINYINNVSRPINSKSKWSNNKHELSVEMAKDFNRSLRISSSNLLTRIPSTSKSHIVNSSPSNYYVEKVTTIGLMNHYPNIRQKPGDMLKMRRSHLVQSISSNSLLSNKSLLPLTINRGMSTTFPISSSASTIRIPPIFSLKTYMDDREITTAQQTKSALTRNLMNNATKLPAIAAKSHTDGLNYKNVEIVGRSISAAVHKPKLDKIKPMYS